MHVGPSGGLAREDAGAVLARDSRVPLESRLGGYRTRGFGERMRSRTCSDQHDRRVGVETHQSEVEPESLR